MLSSRVKTVVLYVVLACWVASLVLDATIKDYDPGSISTVFMSIASLILGGEVATGFRKRKDDTPELPGKDPAAGAAPQPPEGTPGP